MKKIKDIIGCALILCGFLGIIVCVIAGCVFAWSNPDMTEMRRFLDYPWPTVGCIVGYVIVKIGCRLVKNG